MILEVEQNSRYITTSGREIQPWSYREIIFDRKTKTYSLGPDVEADEF